MKKFLKFLLVSLLLLTGCSKVPLSDIIGTWTVEDVSVHTTTSNSENTANAEAWGGYFSRGAVIVFGKGYMRPDPERTFLSQYSEFDGTVKCTYSGGRLIIPEVSFYEQSESSFSSATIGREEYDVSMSDGLLKLSGSRTETDKLGNVKSKSEATILLKKSNQ